MYISICIVSIRSETGFCMYILLTAYSRNTRNLLWEILVQCWRRSEQTAAVLRETEAIMSGDQWDVSSCSLALWKHTHLNVRLRATEMQTHSCSQLYMYKCKNHRTANTLMLTPIHVCTCNCIYINNVSMLYHVLCTHVPSQFFSCLMLNMVQRGHHRHPENV